MQCLYVEVAAEEEQTAHRACAVCVCVYVCVLLCVCVLVCYCVWV
jgi:hypothetical protein